MVIKTRPAAQFGLLRELRRRLKSAFDTAGIAFAYAGGPTEVVLRDESPPGAAPGGRRPPAEPDHPTDPDTSAADPSD